MGDYGDHDFIDLHFLGLKRVVGTAVLDGPSGLTLIDPGPTSCLPALESGLADRRPSSGGCAERFS